MSTAISHDTLQTAEPSLIWALVRKDWFFVRWPMLGYLLCGLVAIGLLAVENKITLIVGVSLLISAIVIIGVHFIFGTVIAERSKQTLPFVLSLPLTCSQYTVAKLIACVGGFLFLWGILLATTLIAIASENHLPAGLAPYATMVLLELFAAFAVTLAVAIVLESEIWTIVTMTVLNVGISIFMNIVGSLSAVGPYTQGPTPVWNATVFGIIGVELLVIALAIVLTLVAQARKTDFI